MFPPCVHLIHEGRGNRVYRVERDDRTFVLKWFDGATCPIEPRAYMLLEELGVPTLPVLGRTENALLLEDLNASDNWRLAASADIEQAATGVAVAAWYRSLHTAGRMLFVRTQGLPDFLMYEWDVLNANTIHAIGDSLDLRSHPALALAIEQIEPLKAAMRTLPCTLTYNDFHWTNLALSRHRNPLRAIVFDYHLLGVGLAYSDFRNVLSALGNGARSAFAEAYGPVDEREAALDAPFAVLYTLHEASLRPRFPKWGEASLTAARDGNLEGSLRRAIAMLT